VPRRRRERTSPRGWFNSSPTRRRLLTHLRHLRRRVPLRCRLLHRQAEGLSANRSERGGVTSARVCPVSVGSTVAGIDAGRCPSDTDAVGSFGHKAEAVADPVLVPVEDRNPLRTDTY